MQVRGAATFDARMPDNEHSDYFLSDHGRGNSAVRSGRTNLHAIVASDFADWQVAVLRSAVRSEAIELYRRLGYDVNNPIL